MMAGEEGAAALMEQEEVEVQIRPKWLNGQCVLALKTSSALNPRFDLAMCRDKLEHQGFQIPLKDLEVPLKTALDVPSVRRYMVFNSALFHFIFAPVLYMVLWCAVFSTLHIYITVSDYWVLCLSVSLVAIFLTTAIIFILSYSNKDINMNLDVRLISVNERMVKHKLLVAVADWVQNCSGNMQLYFVYWDMSRCLRAMTEALEERNFIANDIQKKLKKKMSHLVLVGEVSSLQAGGSEVEEDLEEQRPLLGDEESACSSSSSQREDTKITADYSLIPEASLPAQTKALQLLMTYSSAYVKLLVSQRLSGPSHHRLRPRRNHCSTAPLCLCQYIRKKILQ